MFTEIRKLDFNNVEDLKKAFPVMKELRAHLSFEIFQDLLKSMAKENYELWAAVENGQILGLVSSRIYTDLVRGAHLYIDDLVTSNSSRSKGIGAQLLNHVEGLARKQGLEVLRLCCVLENESALKFYRREKWKERAYALVKRVNV